MVWFLYNDKTIILEPDEIFVKHHQKLGYKYYGKTNNQDVLNRWMSKFQKKIK